MNCNNEKVGMIVAYFFPLFVKETYSSKTNGDGPSDFFWDCKLARLHGKEKRTYYQICHVIFRVIFHCLRRVLGHAS